MHTLVMAKTLKYGIFYGTKDSNKKRLFLIVFFLLVLIGLFVLLGETKAEATRAEGDGAVLPWEAPLQYISGSMTGPVAKSLCLIMVVVSVGVLIFGGDLAGWARSVAFMTLAAGILGGANSFLGLFNVTGALM